MNFGQYLYMFMVVGIYRQFKIFSDILWLSNLLGEENADSYDQS